MRPPMLLAVVGTRPEAIKVAPVVLAARSSGLLDVVVLATGQHDVLVDRALDAFGVPVDIRLEVGARRGGSQSELLACLLPQLEEQITRVGPDAVLVQGDTASALAGAMASSWRRIPVVHLEAGLRSFDTDNPFPEETYRTLIADLASLHLAPTAAAVANLQREGIDPSSVLCVGNTVVDAARFAAGRSTETLPCIGRGRRLVVLTAHRRENWGAPLDDITAAVRALVSRVEDIEVVVPVHPNPLVHEPVRSALGGIDRIDLVDPLEHAELIRHLAAASLVLTDSGGIQEEAPTFGTPVLVLRRTTERPEAVAAGCAELVGTDTGTILGRAEQLLTDEAERRQMSQIANPFGDGRSGSRTVQAVRWFLGRDERPEQWTPGELETTSSAARTAVLA